MRWPGRLRRGPVQLAGVDLHGGRLLTYSQSLTTDGFWLATGLFELLPDTASDRELGEAVGRMLDASLQNVHAPDLRRTPSPLSDMYAAVGARSYAAYVPGTRHVTIEQRIDRTEVMPSRNGGYHEGFLGLPEQAISVGTCDALRLGALVRLGIDRAC